MVGSKADHARPPSLTGAVGWEHTAFPALSQTDSRKMPGAGCAIAIAIMGALVAPGESVYCFGSLPGVSWLFAIGELVGYKP